MGQTKLIGICNQGKLAFDVPADIACIFDAAAAIDVDRGQDMLDPAYNYAEELTDTDYGYHFYGVAADIVVDDLSEAEVMEIMYGKTVGIVECYYKT